MNTTVLSLVTYAGIASSVGAVLLGIKDLFFPPRIRNLTLRDAFHHVPAADADKRQGLVARFDHWFERTLYLAKPGMTSMSAALLLILVGLTLGSAAFVSTENVPLTVLAALIGIAGMMGYFIFAKHRRLKKFQAQFPSALDLLARSVRAGESLEKGIDLVAGAIPQPAATEFQLCSQQLEMGLSMPAAMKSFSERIGLMDVRIFANALSIHRQSGGNVAVTVERLAEVIRERMEYHRQLKSVTGAGRLSVMLILTLGPILFGYLFFFQPEYGQTLWSDPTGRAMLLAAAVSQAIGLFWVSRVLKKDY